MYLVFYRRNEDEVPPVLGFNLASQPNQQSLLVLFDKTGVF